MQPTHDISCLPATKLARLIKDKKISPVELVQACLLRIEKHNSSVNALCTLSEQAIDEARRAEKKLFIKALISVNSLT